MLDATTGSSVSVSLSPTDERRWSKELRGGTTRTLFAFDPRRTAILLLGGDKSGERNRWYETAIPAADDLYDERLATIDSNGPT